MTHHTSAEAFIQAERDFPTIMTQRFERPWGILYFNPEIRESYDCNHAWILAQGPAVASAVEEVIAFYSQRQQPPRVYSYSPDGRPELRAELLRHGFQFTDHPNHLLVHSAPSRLVNRQAMPIQRVSHMDDTLRRTIETHAALREVRVLEAKLRCPDFYLFAAYAGSSPVSWAALHQVGPVCRVDDVFTPPPHRGRGFCRHVIAHLVAFHARHLGNTTLMLYSDNPTAIRIYQEAGFVQMLPELKYWSAWRDPAPAP